MGAGGGLQVGSELTSGLGGIFRKYVEPFGSIGLRGGGAQWYL